MTTNDSKPTPGPDILNERTLTGIVVHLLGLATGVVGPGIVYLVSKHEFTKENARNAVNWHLSVTVVTAIALISVILGADSLNIPGIPVEAPLLGGSLGTAFGILGTALMLLAMTSWLATFFLGLFAGFKALTGNTWEYPLARDFLTRERGAA